MELPPTSPASNFQSLLKELANQFQWQITENRSLRQENDQLKLRLASSTHLSKMCERSQFDRDRTQEAKAIFKLEIDYVMEQPSKNAVSCHSPITWNVMEVDAEPDVMKVHASQPANPGLEQLGDDYERWNDGFGKRSSYSILEHAPLDCEKASCWSSEGHHQMDPPLHKSEMPESEREKFLETGAFPAWFNPLQGNGANDASHNDNQFGKRSSVDPAQLARLGEIDEKHKRDRLVLAPLGKVRLTWDVLWTVALLVECFITPIDSVFIEAGHLPHEMQVVTRITLITFCLDIVLNFFTGYIEAGTEILERRKVIARYLRFWFWFDVLVTFPWDEFISADGAASSSTARASQVFRVQKLLKLLRLFKVVKQVNTAKHAKEQHDVNKLIKGPQAESLSDAVLSWLAQLLKPLKFLNTPLQMCCLIGCLSHFHGAVWAWLIWNPTDNSQLAFERYWESMWWAFSTFTFGNPPAGDTPGLWTLNLVMLAERSALVILAASHAMFNAMVMHQDDANQSLRSHYAMEYLKGHDVSIRTQVQMLFSVCETGKKRKELLHFERLLQDGIPQSLQKQVREELWSRRLRSLALLQTVNNWEPSIVSDMCQLVSEESYASRVVIFKQGDAGDVSYLVLSGTMMVFNQAKDNIPPFTKQMWLGERALINPGLRRSATVISKTVSALLRVPAKDFHKLLQFHSLLDTFQQFCSQELWKGCCGRCGSIGDHFADQCPNAKQIQVARRRSSVLSRLITTVTQQKADQQGSKFRLSRDLEMFLDINGLSRLSPVLERLGIRNLDSAQQQKDLIVLEAAKSPETELSAEEQECFSLEGIRDFEDSIMKSTMSMLREKVDPGHHFMFLSHYKAEAGTEAALMRSEFAALISDDQGHPAKDLESPIFLDSEDLSDLRTLCDSVVKSHNLVIMLTKGILTRPWCIVEIATAVRNNVSLVPVQIFKPTDENFRFPDEQFYKDMADGSLLGESGTQTVLQEGFNMEFVCEAVRRVFKHIALPYSPHKSAAIRNTELKAILRQCVVREIAAPGVQRCSSNRPQLRRAISMNV